MQSEGVFQSTEMSVPNGRRYGFNPSLGLTYFARFYQSIQFPFQELVHDDWTQTPTATHLMTIWVCQNDDLYVSFAWSFQIHIRGLDCMPSCKHICFKLLQLMAWSGERNAAEPAGHAMQGGESFFRPIQKVGRWQDTTEWRRFSHRHNHI